MDVCCLCAYVCMNVWCVCMYVYMYVWCVCMSVCLYVMYVRVVCYACMQSLYVGFVSMPDSNMCMCVILVCMLCYVFVCVRT